jgi:hypothetical protein
MLALNCPIAKADWSQVVAERNGVSRLSPPLQDQTMVDAGPWESIVKKIIEFQHLGDNWDGLGALAPACELLESAVALAYLLSENGVAPPCCVVPGLDGSVNLEWQDADGTVAEIEIDRPLHADVMVIEPGKSPAFWTLPTD